MTIYKSLGCCEKLCLINASNDNISNVSLERTMESSLAVISEFKQPFILMNRREKREHIKNIVKRCHRGLTSSGYIRNSLGLWNSKEDSLGGIQVSEYIKTTFLLNCSNKL